MKKEEKTRITYEKIISVSIKEFGDKGYENTSLTTLCKKYDISKGLLYHNFPSKDELYLECVSRCFKNLVEAINNFFDNSDDVKSNINSFLNCREQFFKENPYYAKIFFNVLLHPPAHLKEKIQIIKKDFDEVSKNYYKEIFKDIELRDDISVSLAVEYLINFQEMFNAYFQSKNYENDNFYDVILEHELSLSKLLDIILYGITKK